MITFEKVLKHKGLGNCALKKRKKRFQRILKMFLKAVEAEFGLTAKNISEKLKNASPEEITQIKKIIQMAYNVQQTGYKDILHQNKSITEDKILDDLAYLFAVTYFNIKKLLVDEIAKEILKNTNNS